jgi:hypothetical protein
MGGGGVSNETRVLPVRTKLISALAVGAILAAGAAATAIAYEAPLASTCVVAMGTPGGCPGFPGLSAKFGIQVLPRKLPRREMAPVAVKLWGMISTSDGTHPSALRELTVGLDRNFAIEARGLPVCRAGGRESIRGACGNAVIGGGRADFELAFPETQPVTVPSKLTIYNLGIEGSVTTLVVTAPIRIPVPRTIAIPVEIEKINEGRSGLRAVAAIPVIAGGSGSLLDFSLEIKRLFNDEGSQKSFATARCPNGELNAEIEALFKNEVHEPGTAPTTVMRGTMPTPCMPMD